MLQPELITRTQKDVSKEETSINSQLLIRAGYVDRLMAGVYSYLPLGVRVLTKIEQIIREEMNALGSQEVLLPALHPKENWNTTGRWDGMDVLFKLKGSGDRDLCLGPTHEEVVTPLIGKFLRSYKDLPASVFQIQTKFRNEARAKSGLLRGREFRMKDMYSFHVSEADLESYYNRATQAYLNVFRRCGLGECTYLTYASGGTFSKYSHEFQTVTPYGEDIIHLCKECRVAINKEIIVDLKGCCPVCNKSNLVEEKAIEVGNIFKLMTKFSDAFSIAYQDSQSKAQQIYMGCYGIGPSRLMGSVAEILHDERGLIWPDELAPFAVHLISISKVAEEVEQIHKIYQELKAKGVSVLFDNRASASPGEKFADSDLIGIPQRVVISSRTLATQSAEIKERRSGATSIIPIAELMTRYSK